MGTIKTPYSNAVPVDTASVKHMERLFFELKTSSGEAPAFPPCNKLQGFHAFGYVVYEESDDSPHSATLRAMPLSSIIQVALYPSTES